jgi:hypothetical protein
MSELKNALTAIERVNFSQLSASESARIGGFLERATAEIILREEAVSQREREVSQRESAATLREEQVEAGLKALTSVQKIRKALDLKPTTAVERVGWLRFRR